MEFTLDAKDSQRLHLPFRSLPFRAMIFGLPSVPEHPFRPIPHPHVLPSYTGIITISGSDAPPTNRSASATILVGNSALSAQADEMRLSHSTHSSCHAKSSPNLHPFGHCASRLTLRGSIPTPHS
jgi:hypothetical protein